MYAYRELFWFWDQGCGIDSNGVQGLRTYILDFVSTVGEWGTNRMSTRLLLRSNRTILCHMKRVLSFEEFSQWTDVDIVEADYHSAGLPLRWRVSFSQNILLCDRPYVWEHADVCYFVKKRMQYGTLLSFVTATVRIVILHQSSQVKRER